jgi:hypothetical protein
MLSARGVERIYGIVVARLEGKPAFDVEYSNGTKLRDVDLGSLLSDENSKRRSIERIDCFFESAQSDRFELKFDSYGQTPIQLTVTSPDRDRVWLTIEELRDYVSNDVASRPPNWVKRLGIPCVTAVFCWLLMGRVPPSVQLPRLAEVIKSPDGNVKLNYLLQRQYQYDSGGLPLATFLLLVVVLLLGLSATLQAFTHGEAFAPLIPRNHFAIGGGAERYQRNLKLRGRIFWGVCVALVVSVLANVLVLLFVPKPT